MDACLGFWGPANGETGFSLMLSMSRQVRRVDGLFLGFYPSRSVRSWGGPGKKKGGDLPLVGPHAASVDDVRMKMMVAELIEIGLSDGHWLSEGR